MHFFNSHQMNVATKAIDDILFGELISPQVFGTLFDYRVAMTFLSSWKDKPVLTNPVFKAVQVCNILGVVSSFILLECEMASRVDVFCGRFT